MRRMILTFLLAAAVAPAAAPAASPDAAKNASGDCTALQARMGPTSFAQAYATFGACVSRFSSLEQQNVAAAQTSCTAQQADPNFAATHNGQTFAQFYGTGKNGNNAMTRCVSAAAKTSSQTEQQGRLNPSRTCRAAESRLGPTGFALLYSSRKNAFGKCVSQTAQAQSNNELNAASKCQSAQSANVTTFAAQFGTNTDKSNAFGKCVSTAAAQQSSSQQQATLSAAKACLGERTSSLSTFNARYASFGACVSLKASGK
jgi:hypothetical protein